MYKRLILTLMIAFLSGSLSAESFSSKSTIETGVVTGDLTVSGTISGTLSPTDVLAAMPTGFSYLTTSACEAGYTTVEDGFIQLGSSPNTTATGSNSKTIGESNLPTHSHTYSVDHNHANDTNAGAAISLGTTNISLASGSASGGDHDHALKRQTAAGTNSWSPWFNELLSNGADAGAGTARTRFDGPHTHTVTGTTNIAHSHGAHAVDLDNHNEADRSTTGTLSGSALDITPRSITMRLCVKT